MRERADPPTLTQLAAAWRRVADDPEIRCAVLTGAGDRVFCAGMDMTTTIPASQRLARAERLDEQTFEGLRNVATALLAGFDLHTPLVCAVNGHARAGGFDLMLAAEIRFAVPHATFALEEVALGLYPTGNATVLLPRQIPWVHAHELLLTARPIPPHRASRSASSTGSSRPISFWQRRSTRPTRSRATPPWRSAKPAAAFASCCTCPSRRPIGARKNSERPCAAPTMHARRNAPSSRSDAPSGAGADTLRPRARATQAHGVCYCGRGGEVERAVRTRGMRIAAIDVGSNSIHMVVAQVESDGRFRVLDRAKEMVRLGQRTLTSGRLSAEAMTAGVRTLAAFKTLAERQGVERFSAVATSAVREAKNGGDFIQRVREEIGLRVKVIPGREEARLIYLGVRHAIDLRTAPTLIVDIGGGSVEFILTEQDKPVALDSLKIGVARLSERYLGEDPPTKKELAALEAYLAEQLEPVLALAAERKVRHVVGTSGTMLTPRRHGRVPARRTAGRAPQ